VKETQHTVVFEVATAATKTQIKEAVQKIFKVKVSGVRTAHLSREVSPAEDGAEGHRSRLEEGLRKNWRMVKK